MKSRILYVRVDAAELAAIEAEVQRDERSMSDVIRRAIRKALL